MDSLVQRYRVLLVNFENKTFIVVLIYPMINYFCIKYGDPVVCVVQKLSYIAARVLA